MNMPSNEEATIHVDCDKRDTFGSFSDVGWLYDGRGVVTHPYSFFFCKDLWRRKRDVDNRTEDG